MLTPMLVTLIALVAFCKGIVFAELVLPRLFLWIRNRPIPLTKRKLTVEPSPNPVHGHPRGQFLPDCLACRLEDSGAQRYGHDLGLREEPTEPVTPPRPGESEALAFDRHRLSVIRERIVRDDRLLNLPREGRRGNVEQRERLFYSTLPGRPERAARAEGWPVFPREPDASLADFIHPPAPAEDPTEPEAVIPVEDTEIDASDMTPIGTVLPGVMMVAKGTAPACPGIVDKKTTTAPYPFPPRRKTAPGGYPVRVLEETCTRCGGPKLWWQTFCGAACSAKSGDL